jgi:hypothetical protein
MDGKRCLPESNKSNTKAKAKAKAKAPHQGGAFCFEVRK